MASTQQAMFGDSAVERRPSAPAAPDAIWREVGGGLLFIVALFLCVCLILGPEQREYVGPVGSFLAESLRLVFGAYISFFAPLALCFGAWRLIRPPVEPLGATRYLGAGFLVVAVCGFLALPNADVLELRQETIARAGALGAFLVEWEGLGLVGALGSVGAAFALAGLAFSGLVLATGFGIGRVGATVVARLREREERIPVPEFAGLPQPEEVAALEEERRANPIRLVKPERTAADSEPSGALEAVSLDNDSEAALKALEEAQVDRDFEEALARELALRNGVMDQQAEAAPEETPIQISFGDDAPKARILAGNPGNEDDEIGPATPVIGLETPVLETTAKTDVKESLAKLFPDKHGKKAEEQRDADEARAFRRVGGGLGVDGVKDSLPEDLEGLDLSTPIEDRDESGDPLFDDSLETRPHGPKAAMEEAKAPRKEVPAPREAVSYRLPDIQLLDDPPKTDWKMPREEMLEISQTLEKTLADFGISAKVVEVKQGPVVTRFELKPAAGVKVSRIVGLEHDIAMAMKAVSVRIMAPIPGKAVVGIEIPNRVRAGVYLKELIGCADFWEQKGPLNFALGKTIEGAPFYCDLRKMPHLLIAGATGAGKSVCLNSIICSILYRMRPDQVRMVMVDPKRVELSVYDAIPHLIAPVVCEPKRAAAALAWAVEQMEERYKKLVEFNVRNIDGYNAIVEKPESNRKAAGKKLEHMPHMVVIVDELADLMITAKAEVEESIQRLAQMARAVGIHLILATQRPSVNVITGIIKANFPSRIAFQVSQKVDSRTILDQNGAEALLGRGDMLFSPGGVMKPLRIQGGFMSDEEVERIASFWREQSGPNYEVEEFEPILSEKEKREMAKLMGNPTDMDDLDIQDDMFTASRGTNKTMGKVHAGMFVPHAGGSAQAGDDGIDEVLVRAAARTILEARSGSTSLVQRRLKLGYARAGRLMDMLEEMGIVGPYKGSKPRDIMVDCDAALAQLDAIESGGSTTDQ